jgi:6-phosphogluconolactonase
VRRLLILPDARTLAFAAAGEFTRAAASSKGPFRVALSGGSTPKALFALLADAASPYRARIPWDRLRFFWGDERCVPPDDPDSNYRMAYEALLSRVPVPAANVYRVPAELPDADEAARRYEATVREVLGPAPRFDWIFLGMGADGHTASLFPGTNVVRETRKLAAAVWVEEKKTFRVTLTLPVLNAAAKVAFVVSGADKAATAQKVLETPPDEARPSSLVSPVKGELIWLLDRDAASRLAPKA